MQDFPRIHPLVKNLFSVGVSPRLPLAGRINFLLRNWQRLTNDKSLLQIVQGYKIPFSSIPKQTFRIRESCKGKEEKNLIEKEVKEMRAKGAMEKVQFQEG